jgi:TnpA family transposase
MSTYAYRYVGQEGLPARLSDFDQRQFFQLRDDDIQAVRQRFRQDRRAAVALRLLFLRAAGRPLDRFAAVPRNLLHHVCEAFGSPLLSIASLRTLYQRRPTLYEHQQWACEYLGLRDLDAAAEGLGFDLCPRLRDLAERKLYLPRGFVVSESIERVTVKRLSLKAIRAGWDELLRLFASIRAGRISADLALRWFGSAAQGDPVHRAADHLGRLLSSIFLCDYFTIDDFRREIHTLLSRGESVHQLQRVVYAGKVPTERGRRRDEMRAISGSHALLTNVVLAWNTSRMNDVVERLRKDRLKIEDDWLRRLGPARFAHINFRGTFRFALERYAQALLKREEASQGAAQA